MGTYDARGIPSMLGHPRACWGGVEGRSPRFGQAFARGWARQRPHPLREKVQERLLMAASRAARCWSGGANATLLAPVRRAEYTSGLPVLNRSSIAALLFTIDTFVASPPLSPESSHPLNTASEIASILSAISWVDDRLSEKNADENALSLSSTICFTCVIKAAADAAVDAAVDAEVATGAALPPPPSSAIITRP